MRELSQLMLPEVKDAGLRYQQRVSKQRPGVTRKVRTAYLARNLTRTKASLCITAAEAAGAPLTSRDTIEQLSQERIIGSTDLVGIETLELAIAVSRSVVRIQIGNAFGTGSLVGPGLLMTNNHVISSPAEGARALAQCDYQENSSGALLARQDFRVDPSQFFITNKELDFTIVGVTATPDNVRWRACIADCDTKYWDCRDSGGSGPACLDDQEYCQEGCDSPPKEAD